MDNYIKNSSIQDQDLNNIYIFLYWKLLSLINHNKILEFCSYLQSHIEQLLYYVEYIQTNNDETNNNKYITIQNFYERANILFGEILKMINVTDECLRVLNRSQFVTSSLISSSRIGVISSLFIIFYFFKSRLFLYIALSARSKISETSLSFPGVKSAIPEARIGPDFDF